MSEVDTNGLRKLADMRRQNGQTRTADALTDAATEIDRLRTLLCTKAHAHIDGAHLGGFVEGCMLCDAMQEREALRKRPAMDWQPIATAPKDGSYILVTNSEAGGAWIATWKPVYQSGYRPENPWQCMMLNRDHLPNKLASATPTAWMPLPEPPR